MCAVCFLAGLWLGSAILQSGKVGSAVVMGLIQHGFKVVAHSSDKSRSKKLLAKCACKFDHEIVKRLRVTTSLVEGVHVHNWVVGKSESKVVNYLPRGAKAVVFCVPSPFTSSNRADLTVVQGGIFHMDATRMSKPRQFANLLASHEALQNTNDGGRNLFQGLRISNGHSKGKSNTCENKQNLVE